MVAISVLISIFKNISLAFLFKKLVFKLGFPIFNIYILVKNKNIKFEILNIYYKYFFKYF